ncbi:hypothetical protein H4Q26_016913 [Puccinia striiformis f. sp. tritici PST-130]|nr:hypothetical protein H4Q26_016913 [Puccinia striiformis f. sp. tritici PST-130]
MIFINPLPVLVAILAITTIALASPSCNGSFICGEDGTISNDRQFNIGSSFNK